MNYCYSLDLVNTGPGSRTDNLITTAKECLTPLSDFMKPEDLYCTMYFKHTQGADGIQQQFFKEKQAMISVKKLELEEFRNMCG